MPNIPFALDNEDLRDAFPPNYLERGTSYFRGGKVLTADYSAAQGLVSGRVRGSDGRVYQSVVHLRREEDGSLKVVGQCSCPVGYNCKHVAALLLSIGDRSATHPHPQPSEGLPPEVRNWLNQVKRVAGRVSHDDPHRLLYLVHCEDRFGLKRTLVRAVRVRRLEDGGYGKPQDYNISGQSRAPFVTPEDLRVMVLIEAGRGRIAVADAPLNDETGSDVLRAIALTGRGHWRTAEGPALRFAGPLAGQLLWRLEDDARLHLRLEADRRGLLLIPAMPPWYLNPESGECGPLETGLGEREAGLLAMAPSMSPLGRGCPGGGGTGATEGAFPASAVAPRAPTSRIRAARPPPASAERGPESRHKGPMPSQAPSGPMMPC